MLKKIQALFEKISAQIENNPTPFPRYLHLFFGILMLRLALEFFSGQRLFILADILHIGLWFVFIVMAFLLQLHLFSGENIIKISKLVITTFSIALTAPLIDLFIFQGKGVKMNYLSLHSWESVFHSYFTIGGASLSRGATPGIRVEIFLLLIACFNYIYIKKRSILRSLFAVISIYTVLFISGAIPVLLGVLVDTFHLQYQHDDQSTVLLLLTVNLFLLLIAFLRYAGVFIFQMLGLYSWIFMAIAVVLATFGAQLALQMYPDNWQLTPTTLLWFPLLGGLFLCFAAIRGLQNSLNNTNHFRRTNILFALILIISISVSYKTLFMAALAWGLLFFLNESPLQFNKIPLLRNVLQGMLMLDFTLLGFVTFGAPMVGFPTAWIFAIFISATLSGILIEKVGIHKIFSGGIN